MKDRACLENAAVVTPVFLHPVGLDGKCWELTSLGGLKPDILGHGSNPFHGDTLTLEGAADQLLGAIDGTLHLVGASMGGALAIRMALLAPERVRSLFIACTSAFDSPERSERLQERANQVKRVGMAGVLQSTLERWFTPEVLASPDHPGVAYARRRLLSDDPDVFAMWWKAMAKHTVRSEIGAIRCPVSLLVGRHDASASVPQVLEIFDALRGRRRMEILPGPHMLPLEAPAAFADAVRIHLEWTDRGNAP